LRLAWVVVVAMLVFGHFGIEVFYVALVLCQVVEQ
jgi:hypothetical protein